MKGFKMIPALTGTSKKLNRTLSFVVLTLTLSACGKVAHDGTAAQSKSLSSSTGSGVSGNGNGYDGKTYVAQYDNQACADGSKTITRIKVYPNGTADLEREQCNDIQPPKRLAATEYKVMNASTIEYHNILLSSGSSPSLSILQPTSGATVSGNILVSGTCSAVGRPVTLTYASQTVQATCDWATSSWSVNIDLALVSPGSVALNAQHADYAQNSSQTSVTVNNVAAATFCAPSATQSCSTGNGTGSQTCDSAGSAWGACGNITSCNSGYNLQNGTCVANVCSPVSTRTCASGNGTGSQTCNSSGSAWGACGNITSCNSGYNLQNGQCVFNSCAPNAAQSCQTGNGTGSQTCNSSGSAWGTCGNITSCNSGYNLQSGACVANVCSPNTSQACASGNGTGSQTCNSSGSAWGTCGNITSCNSGYNLQNGVCVFNSCVPSGTQSCQIGNGTGSQTCNSSGSAWGTCGNITSCNSGFNLQNGTCVANVCSPNTSQACTSGNGTGSQTCNSSGSAWGTCGNITSCNSGYNLQSGACVANVCSPNTSRSCLAGNGTGSQTCNNSGSAWGTCGNITSCNSGFYLQSGTCVATPPAPTVSITSTAAAVNASNGSLVPFSGQCSASGQTLTVSVGTVSGTTTCNSNWSLNLNLSSLSDGAKVASVSITDLAGQTATTSMNINKDTVLPQVTINAPAQITTSTATAASFSGTCSESGLPVSIGGAASASVLCSNGQWSSTLNLSAVPVGAFNLTASQTDSAGNLSSVTKALTMAFVAPGCDFMIANATDFENSNWLAAKTYCLQNDIVFTRTPTQKSLFGVTLDGKGFKLIGLQVTSDGLFGGIYDSVITNLTFDAPAYSTSTAAHFNGLLSKLIMRGTIRSVSFTNLPSMSLTASGSATLITEEISQSTIDGLRIESSSNIAIDSPYASVFTGNLYDSPISNLSISLTNLTYTNASSGGIIAPGISAGPTATQRFTDTHISISQFHFNGLRSQRSLFGIFGVYNSTSLIVSNLVVEGKYNLTDTFSAGLLIGYCGHPNRQTSFSGGQINASIKINNSSYQDPNYSNVNGMYGTLCGAAVGEFQVSSLNINSTIEVSQNVSAQQNTYVGGLIGAGNNVQIDLSGTTGLTAVSANQTNLLSSGKYTSLGGMVTPSASYIATLNGAPLQ